MIKKKKEEIQPNDHYIVTINFRDGSPTITYDNIVYVSVSDGLVGIASNKGDKWVYPVDTIKNYYLKTIQK